MLSVSAEEKLDKIAKRLAQWGEDYFLDNQDIQRRRKDAEQKGDVELKKFEERLPARLKERQEMREKAKYGLPDIMTSIKQMKELTDMVLPQHKVVVPAPVIVKTPDVKKASPKNKSAKKERCPNGTKRNAKTGKCEAK
jgi:hypothetical protein